MSSTAWILALGVVDSNYFSRWSAGVLLFRMVTRESTADMGVLL